MARPSQPSDAPAGSEAARLVDLVKATVPPMHPAGLPFVAAGLGLAGAGRRRRWLRTAGLTAAGACALFFRHPPRTPPSRPGVVVAPADGRITLIDRELPPEELGMPAVPMTRISIFLSLFDVHVQRVPIAGEVVAVVHRPGEFMSADRQRASTDNERNSMWIRTPDGIDVAVVQIAGVLARRIVCDVTAGDTPALGDTYGLIRFGSRLDTYVPEGSTVLVESQQRAIGGETVLAELAR